MTVLKNPVPQDVVTIISSPSRGEGAELVFTTLLSAGAAGSPPHRHSILTEVFEVLEGEITLRLGQSVRVLRAKEIVTVHPNTTHGFRNASDAPALLRCTVTPGASFERFLRGLQIAAETGRTNSAGLPRDPRHLSQLLCDADFHFPGLPMRPQRALLRLLAALAPNPSLI